jgi:hypothetical protein
MHAVGAHVAALKGVVVVEYVLDAKFQEMVSGRVWFGT